MSKIRRKGISQKKLTEEEVKKAAQKLMAGAQAHQRASAYCFDNPSAKPQNIDALFFPVVPFELILISIGHDIPETPFPERME